MPTVFLRPDWANPPSTIGSYFVEIMKEEERLVKKVNMRTLNRGDIAYISTFKYMIMGKGYYCSENQRPRMIPPDVLVDSFKEADEETLGWVKEILTDLYNINTYEDLRRAVNHTIWGKKVVNDYVQLKMFG